MGVADVSGTAEAGQSTERDAEHRVGLGLLSRFIGAVFLVLLAGLLLLDRALVRANRNQGALDAQSSALLAESFVNAHDVLLDRLLELADGRPDSARGSEASVLVDSVDRARLPGRLAINVLHEKDRPTRSSGMIAM